MEIPLMRRNALTFTLPAYAVLLVLVLLSAVGKADEKHAAPSASPLLLVSSVDVPVADAQELLHDDNATPTTTSPPPRVLKMEVTAYCPCKKCCGKNARGVTASGAHISHNDGLFVAADTTLLPFRTKLLIPGYANGKAVPVLDRGGAIKGEPVGRVLPDARTGA